MQRINSAKFILISQKIGLTEAKFDENVLFFKFYDFSMHEFFFQVFQVSGNPALILWKTN